MGNGWGEFPRAEVLNPPASRGSWKHTEIKPAEIHNYRVVRRFISVGDFL